MGLATHIKNDLKFLTGVAGALRRVVPMARHKTRTFPDVAEELARRFGDRPALLSDRETLTYAEYNRRGNRYARWALYEAAVLLIVFSVSDTRYPFIYFQF